MAVTGSWAPSPVALTYQWLSGGAVIDGATQPSFEVTSLQLGKSITVAVTGTKFGFATATRTSTATAVVTDGASPILVAGNVAESAVWSPQSASYYELTSNVIVPAGVTLTIDSGTVIRVDAGYSLQVDGSLVVDGTAGDPVTFGATTPGSTWLGFEIGTADASIQLTDAIETGSNYAVLTDSLVGDGATGALSISASTITGGIDVNGATSIVNSTLNASGATSADNGINFGPLVTGSIR